ncbi:uncharacterized protein UTRI_00407_B [Ustilago trichophora]|uniref:Uncharacterized protein n=1 Tax=Ustilago trichophora TaxID=86804 RepID=A0A5C3DPB4_9BASI|nr:uncharacterized protein UTRI_00407_B [Ustilago trichophora]
MYRPAGAATPTRTEREKSRNAGIYELARSEAETHWLNKVTGSSASATRGRNFLGTAFTQSIDTDNVAYRRNITLKDSSAVLLQRFGPASYDDEEGMEEEAKEGARLLKVLYRDASAQPSNRLDLSENGMDDPQFELGALYLGEDPYLSWQTLQRYKNRDERKNKAGRKAVADFIAWFNHFSERFLLPVARNPDSGLCDDFRLKLYHRIKYGFPWTAKWAPGVDRICQPFYSTFTPRKGFDAHSKIDEEDADPSILVNFGQHALLELPDYNCTVELQPLEIVVFAASHLRYRTRPHPKCQEAGLDPGERWSVLCFFLRAFEQRLMSADNIFYFLLKADNELKKRQLGLNASAQAADEASCTLEQDNRISNGINVEDEDPANRTDAGRATRHSRSNLTHNPEGDLGADQEEDMNGGSMTRVRNKRRRSERTVDNLVANAINTSSGAASPSAGRRETTASSARGGPRVRR